VKSNPASTLGIRSTAVTGYRLDSIFGSAATHGVTQKPTPLINQGFAIINCKFFFHESAG
jgi:hypothetical protein